MDMRQRKITHFFQKKDKKKRDDAAAESQGEQENETESVLFEVNTNAFVFPTVFLGKHVTHLNRPIV